MGNLCSAPKAAKLPDISSPEDKKDYELKVLNQILARPDFK